MGDNKGFQGDFDPVRPFILAVSMFLCIKISRIEYKKLNLMITGIKEEMLVGRGATAIGEPG